MYRVTIHVVPNLLLTSKQKFRFSRRPMCYNATFVLMSMKAGNNVNGHPVYSTSNTPFSSRKNAPSLDPFKWLTIGTGSYLNMY